MHLFVSVYMLAACGRAKGDTRENLLGILHIPFSIRSENGKNDGDNYFSFEYPGEKLMMDSRRYDVVVVGELNPDLILSGDVVPEFGQVEKLVENSALTIGSSSAIFACGAARLGLRVAFIGKIGTDEFGFFMRHSLEEYGIDTSGIVEDNETPTGLSIILSRGTDRAILTFPGTIPCLRYYEIRHDLLAQSRHLHLGSYFIQKALRLDVPNLFDLAHQYGLSISLDTNYDPSETWNEGIEISLQKVDIFLPNELECLAISGKTNLDEAVDYLGKKVRFLGVKLGDRGALLRHNSKQHQEKSILVDVVDTVGAGDSFDAGFVYGYLAGWNPARVLKFATICGCLSTRKVGGTRAQPTLEEALGYL
jgi:sugar/nucleoside kinase (ribokinase family)